MKVETYSGYKLDEYPVRFWIFDGEPLEVLEIEDRWYGPGFTYFKVFADNARHYILTRNNEYGTWQGREVQT
ncbi:hypothetical protein QA601_13410 [Chitinispirillales bacterium ANBcel5]|uniref:hypothetical protein n=1 Tax=Cellulosispirillum alkaliphilum TaxID=3039283 RepID=UPI002A532687|nr:hypothetical protein [Chitinispirillales bacterium ANBcel5]